MTRSTALVLVALASAACSERTAPPPSPQPTAQGALRPLTSRERGDASQAPPPASGAGEQALPPGHPPLQGAAAGPALPASHGMPEGGTPSFAGGSVAGTVSIAPALASRIGTNDVLYLIARDTTTRQVSAVKRVDKPRFPPPLRARRRRLDGWRTAVKGPFRDHCPHLEDG